MADMTRLIALTGSIAVVGAFVAALAFGGFGALTARASQTSSRPAQAASAPRPEIPPIDAAAPQRVETATFALG